MNAFGKMAELLVTICLLFFVPLQYMAAKQDIINQIYVTSETSYFVDSVRNLGYMNKEMYETFVRKIHCTGNTYKIEMNHYKYVLEPFGDSYRGHYYGSYGEEIREKIYSEGKDREYLFHQGDYFVLKVKNKNKTFGNRMQEMFMRIKSPTEQIYVVYGGAIRDEIY